MTQVAGVDISPDSVSGWSIAVGTIVIAAELLLILAYAARPGVVITRPLILLVPFVWINLSIWAVWRRRPRLGFGRPQLVAGAIAAGYFLVLAYVGGLVVVGGAGTGFDLRLTTLPPGWSPVLSYQGSLLGFTILPYKLIGYLALSYLVYGTVLDASSALVGGVVGVFSCVSCTFPVIAALMSGVTGGTALTAFAYGNAYILSTIVFVVTVLILVLRPRLPGPAG